LGIERSKNAKPAGLHQKKRAGSRRKKSFKIQKKERREQGRSPNHNIDRVGGTSSDTEEDGVARSSLSLRDSEG